MNIEKIFSFRSLIILILISLFSYSSYWLIISNMLKNNLVNQLSQNNCIIYENLKISGFPTHIQTNISELKILNSKTFLPMIDTKNIKLSMHPFDMSKIALSSNSLLIEINKDDLIFKVNLNQILSLISFSKENLVNINTAIENVKINTSAIFLGNVNQVHIKLNETSPNEFILNMTVNSARLEPLNYKEISVKAEGSIRLDNKKLNGKVDLLIKDRVSNEDIFNLPLDIKHNQVIILFMNVFDLNDLLTFF